MNKVAIAGNLGIPVDLVLGNRLPDLGKGLPIFTEKGSVIRRELERFIVDEELKRGYKHIYSPELANVELYKTSGHYPYYKDTMYPVMKVDQEELMLRPMTCPHHFQLYASAPHSYKELPFRIAELAKQFRYEKSGELTGLMRVRSFCLADAHIICKKEQATGEINSVLDLIEYAASALGLKKEENYRYRLSLGNRADAKKYYKDNKAWDFAENVLRSVLEDRKSPFFEEENKMNWFKTILEIGALFLLRTLKTPQITQREKRGLNKNVNEDVNKTSTLIEENRTEENRREEIKEEGEESPPFPSTEIKKPKKKTIPPSINDVKAYCQERKNNVDPETWINHYKSNGWMVGKNKMKNWKAAVITWEKRGGNGNGSKGIGTYRTDIRGHQILDEAEQINRDYLAAKAARAARQTADDKARGAADNDDAPDFPV